MFQTKPGVKVWCRSLQFHSNPVGKNLLPNKPPLGINQSHVNSISKLNKLALNKNVFL